MGRSAPRWRNCRVCIKVAIVCTFPIFMRKGGGAILMKSALLLYIHILGFSFMYSSWEKAKKSTFLHVYISFLHFASIPKNDNYSLFLPLIITELYGTKGSSIKQVRQIGGGGFLILWLNKGEGSIKVTYIHYNYNFLWLQTLMLEYGAKYCIRLYKRLKTVVLDMIKSSW